MDKMDKYDHKEIDKKWQSEWAKQGLYKVKMDPNKPKYYILDMFPYPSGEGLHVGHPKGYIATDILARMKMLAGYNVLHPMGWDAFGLPAENYALKTKTHPKKSTDDNIATYKSQLEKIGFTYDWDREINTTDPDYYKWTQWTFLKMYEKGLAYQSCEPINWCPSCQTGLAQEDLDEGKCERCGSEIERKPMRQWVLKITDYADRMLNDLDKLNGWEDSIKEMQRNWIGRSEGAEIQFSLICHYERSDSEVKDPPLAKTDEQSAYGKSPQDPNGSFADARDDKIKVFTTRPDTLFGCTYCVVAPEHPQIANYKEQITNWPEVERYIENSKKKSDLERTDLNKDKTGVRIEGITAVNPANGEEVPIFVADYVLPGYGTGAIMAVPAHDPRDWDFAIANAQKIKYVNVPFDHKDVKNNYHPEFLMNMDKGESHIEAEERQLEEIYNKISQEKEYCFFGKGKLVNSGFLDGLSTDEAKEKMTKWLEEKGLGEKKINYKLKDWVFSRQRYWGEPIPMVHCPNCGTVPVPEDQLPVKLPEVDHYEPTGTGESPLAGIDEWVNTACPRCGGQAKRETNTMPQWAGSSWYYLRYMDPKNDQALVEKAKEEYWSPVDFYVGGAEHATRHLIYARFWHKFLYDIGVVGSEEPFIRLQHVGLVQAEDGRKMSKRWGNVINPDDITAEYGADALRVYEMFMGPFDQACAWSANGLMGARRFLDKVWALSDSESQINGSEKDLLSLLHKTIKKTGEDIPNFKFNTAISQMMIFVNKAMETGLEKELFEKFLIILSPFAPHLAEEIWEKLGHKESIFKEKWPEYDPELAKDEEIELVLQINGKVRDTVKAAADISEEEAKKLAYESEKVQKWLKGKKVVKEIFVPGKLVNIVIR